MGWSSCRVTPSELALTKACCTKSAIHLFPTKSVADLDTRYSGNTPLADYPPFYYHDLPSLIHCDFTDGRCAENADVDTGRRNWC